MTSDPSGLQVFIDPIRADQWASGGQWQNLTLADRARALAATQPDHVTHIDGQTRLTAAQAWQGGLRLASALRAQGWQAGEVLAFETPNWHEAVLIDLAAVLLGLVVCPIVPIYRDHEVGQILSDAGAKGLFIASQFRGFDYVAMMQRLRPSLPKLRSVWTVRGEPGASQDLQALMQSVPPLSERPTDWPTVRPDAVKLVLYTSGTTGHPKAVLHSHNTLARGTLCGIEHWGIQPGDTTLMPSPVTHVTGFANGIELPFYRGVTCVLLDQWNAAVAADLIERYSVCFTLCATPFLQELLDLAEREQRTLPSLRCFPCGGAAVSPDLIHRVARVLANCRAFRVYGASEAPLVTLGWMQPGQEALAAETDGQIVDYEVRIVGYDETDLPDGTEGEIRVRGPALFLGYARADDTALAFDRQGYYCTGDVGWRTVEGAVVFSGRIKDLINRGGEKISAKEVEDLLHSHPGVQQAAVVAMPHHRLGETVCAYVIAKPGIQLTTRDITALLDAAGVAKQKYPERCIFVDDFPKTASGKVKKDLLRANARERLSQAAVGAEPNLSTD